MNNIAPVVEFRNVSFSYQQQTVVEQLHFTVTAGEFVGIIGPNGSGKTTLLKLLLGLLKPTEGEVFLYGERAQLGKNTTTIGYIPQKISLLESRFPITVREVVQLGRMNQHKFGLILSKKDQAIVENAIRIVGLSAQQHCVLTELSGGQQQRVFIAKALATEPKILVLDEPTVGVDTESQTDFYHILQTLNQEKGITILLVSHDVDVVTNEVRTVLCLNKSLVYHGTTHHFLRGNYLEKMYGEGTKRVVHTHAHT